MANSIEIPVSLALQNAQEQIAFLKKLLQESVQPDSSAFKTITSMLERATTQAERLKQTMGESFKTSSGSKKFQNDLQKTFDLIATATGRLQTVSGKDLILSDEDNEKVKKFSIQIDEIQNKLNNIRSGKIGDTFDDSSIDKIKQVQDVAKSLGKDLGNITFSQLSRAIQEELNSVNQSISNTKDQIVELDKILNSENLIDANKLTETLSELGKASSKPIFNADNMIQANAKLSEFYNLYQDLGIKPGKIKTDTSVEAFINAEIKKVIDSTSQKIGELKVQKDKLQQALNDLSTIQVGKKGQTKQNKQEIFDRNTALLQSLGFSTDKTNIDAVAKQARDFLEQALNKIDLQEGSLSAGSKNIQEGLRHLFDGIDFTQVLDGTKINQIKEAITALFPDNKITDSSILTILKEMKSGDNAAETMQRLATAINQVVAASSSSRNDLTNTLQLQEQEANNLSQSLVTVNEAQDKQSQEVEQYTTKIRELEAEIQKLIAERQKIISEKIETDPGISAAKTQYEQATTALKNYANGLANLESKQKALGNVQMAVTRWMGFYQVLNLTKRAVQEMKTHIQELDEVMTKIAVVTNMSQDDLWGQIKQYSEIARQYGVAIKGVYEVSQIYYQQGLNKGDVMNLTTETLKMARISGLDYATAADYMTTAIRGFKLEMSDAAHVTDVYSALAAKTASSTEELAVAISKTASSAEAVGSSFEATSAMMATMIATTRESATNIGTALKSVISRYGEMTSDPSKLVDSEGEEMSLNRVDAALKTIGITLQDVNGQFRDFDDVILELGEKWGTLDKNSQRYIATLMAGNRQQSRFLALVSNIDEYKNALEIATNSADAGELQTLKTLDSIDAKIEKMKVTVQEFYTSSGLQDLYKGILDTITNVIDAANNLPKVFGKIPAAALTIGVQVISAIKNVITLIIKYIQAIVTVEQKKITNLISINLGQTGREVASAARAAGEQTGDSYAQGMEDAIKRRQANIKTAISSILSAVGAAGQAWASVESISALNTYGSSTLDTTDQKAGYQMGKSGVIQIASGAISAVGTGLMVGGWPGAIVGIASMIPSLITGITSINSGMEMYNVTLERQLELSNKRIESARQESVKAKGEVTDLQTSINKLKQLEEAQYDSADAMQEYIEYRNQLVETYPNLLDRYDSEYNAVIKTADAYKLLAEKINEALQKQLLYNKEELDQAKLKNSAALQYQENVKVPLTGYYNSYDSKKIKFTSESVGRDRYLTVSQWKRLGLTTGNYGDFGQQTFGYTSGDITERKYNNATFDPNILYKLSADANLWENQYYLIYDIMNQGGAFSGAFDDLIKTQVDQAKNMANIGKYDEAIQLLIKARQTILDSSQDYLKLQEKLQTDAARQTIALTGFTSSLDTENELKVKKLVEFYNNGILRSLFSATVDQANIDENNRVSVDPEVYGDIKLDLDEYGKLLGEYLYNVYSGLTEDQQKKLTDIIKNRSSYSSYQEYQNAIIQLLGKDPFSVDIWEGQKTAIENETKQASERISNYIENLEGRGFDFKGLQSFEMLFTKDTDNLSYAYVDAVIKDMEYYTSQIDNGMIIYGNNIFDLIYKYWDAVGKISDADTQIKISSMLRGIDRQDINEINKLIETLENEEGYDAQSETGQVVKALKEYRDALNVSINTMAQEFIGKTKNAEKAIEDLSKIQKSGFSSFEDMSKAFQALESAGFTGTWAEAFVLDEGVWKYSAEGYKTAIGKINDTIEKDKEKLKTEIENLTGAQELITNSTNGVDFFTVSNYNYVKKTFDKSDAYGIKGVLKALYNITDEATLNQLTDQITSGIIPLGNSMEEFHNNILTWIKNQLGDAANQINGANQFIANLKFSQIDFNAITSGTANKDLTISQIQDALVTSGKQETEASTLAEYIWDELIAGTYDTLNAVAPFLITDSFKDSLRSNKISKYQTAITETLNASTAPISAATAGLIGQVDKAHQKIEDAAFDSIGKAIEFLDTIENLLSIEDYNKSAREILEKSLAKTDGSDTQGNVYKAIDFATGNLDISSFETLANNFGAKLSDWFDLETGDFEWFDEEGNQIVSVFKDILSYNNFTGQFDIVGTVDEFISAVADATGTFIAEGTAEYAQLYSDIVDKKITAKKSETAAISKQVEQLQSLAQAKIGDILNVSYLSELLTQPIQKALMAAGVTIQDGMAIIGDNFNLREALTALTSIDTSGSVQLVNAVEALKDSILSIFSNWTSLISNGISGKLSYAGKNELQQIAKDYLGIELNDSSFTRTKEGLKLSQQAAIELYNTLKNIDRISAQIVFDELNKSLKETNEHYKTINSVMVRIAELNKLISSNKYDSTKIKQYKEELSLAKEIAAVRTTTEDSSFDFMSAELPGALNNAPKYWESWAQAVSVSEQAAKDGYIGWQEFARMVQGVSDLAVQTGQDMQFMGQTILADGTSAAKLIEQGYDALTIDVASGKAVLNLGELFSATGMNFKQGAKGFSKDITKGIRDYAKSQVKMLDGMISMLETIVAMEKLGDIAGEDGDANTISVQDILPNIKFDEAGKAIKGTGEQYSKTYENYIKELRKRITKGNKEYNKQLAKGMESFKINGVSLAEIVNMSAEELRNKGEAFTQAYTQIIQAMADAAKNGDWDAAFDVIKSNLESLNFGDLGEGTVQFDFAGITYEYKEGITLQKVGDKYVVNGTEYSDWDEAKAALKVQNIDGLGDLTLESKKEDVVTFTNELGVKISYNVKTGQYTAKFSDGAVISSDSPEGLNIGISAWAKTIGQSLDSENANIESKKPVTFTVQQEGVIDTTFILKDGKVEVDSSRTTASSTAASIINAGNAYVETTKTQNTQQATETPAEQEITVKNDQVPQALADNQAKGKESPVTQEVVLTETTVPVQEIIGIIQNLKLQFTGTPDSSGITIPTNIPVEGTYYALLAKLILGMAQGKSPDPNDLKALAETAAQITGISGSAEVQSLIYGMSDNPTYNKLLLLLAASLAAQGIDVPTASAIISQLIIGTPKETDKKALEDAVNAAAQGIEAGPGTANVSNVDVSLGENVVPNVNDVETKARQKVQNMNLGAATGTVNNIIVDAAKAVKTLKSGETVTITGLPDADGEITTLTVTATNKILSDTSGFDTNNASGTAKNFDMAVESYHLEFKKEDVNNPGQFIMVTEIDVPANVLFGGEESLQAYLTNQTDLTTPEIEAVLSDLQELINNNGPYEASINFIPPKGKLELPGIMGYDVDTNWGISTLNKSRQKFQETNDWDIAVEAAGGFDNLKAAFLAYKESIEDEDFIIDFKAGLIDEATLNQELYNFITEHSDEILYIKIKSEGTEEVETELQDIKNKENELSDKSIEIEANTSSAIKGLSAVRDEIANIKGKSVTITTYKRTVEERTQATGNVSIATGNAMAQGTLMGELGPELVVSKGRYFVVGQEGAEFVNLDKDAIVFNHLQTQSLLKNGKAGRGKPQTNERNATSFATGNVDGGPAMASASSALATLRHIRAQWQKIASMSVSDLAQKGGGGGGGGGGGKDKDAAFIRDVERWYNWLQRIAQLEKEITHEEQLRSKLESDRNKNGKAYYESQKKSLADIREQTAVTTSLLTSQQEYFNQRREELNKSPMSRFYTFDENGQLQYTKNPEGFAELSDLFGRNDEGKPNYTAEEQYNKLVAMGYASYMKYDSSGKEIKPEGKNPDAAYFENAVKAFSERMDSEKEEMQSLHDSIEEYQTSILELEQKRNELIQEMIDNQIEVENQVLQAIEDMRQAQIDEAQADRDAYSESTEKYINGLNDALNREKQMYENKENEAELEKLRRQLAILERSGGSASQIAGLQKDIQSKEQDLYFDKQQQQIDAIKEASDLQIERMDHQIKIMEETLAYEKAHGLLWEKVYEVMAGTPEEIREFVALNTKSLQEQSAAQSEQNLNKMEWQIEQWVAYREDEKKEISTNEANRRWNNSVDSFKTTYSKVYTDELAAKAREAYEASYEKYGDETKAHAAAQEIFKNAQAEYDAAHYIAPTTTTTSAAATTSKNGSGGGGGRNNNKTSTTSKNTDKVLSGTGKDKLEYIDVTSTLVSGSTKIAKGYTVTYKDSKTKKNKSVNYSAVGNGSLASAKAKAEAYAKKFKGAKVTPYYKYGGLVDYTGLAQVDGTPSRPESFLNASQTAILKKGLLGGKNSLVSVLADFQAMLEGSSHATVEKNNSSIVIENATVQMNVQHMNNDYDARRAGEQALEQIVKVARKTGAQSVSRR